MNNNRKPNKVTKSEKLQSLKDLTSENLLSLYSEYVRFVRFDHYNGYQPSPFDMELIRLKIEVKDIEDLVLARMRWETGI